jgi:hypothetical protein
LLAPGHQPGDVDELDDRRHDALGLDDRGQRVQPRVGQLDDADVRLDGAERVVLGRDAGLGQRVEEGGLADVGQAHDAAFQAHVVSSRKERIAQAQDDWEAQRFARVPGETEFIPLPPRHV